MKLVLFNYWRSSSSHRVRIGLELKGLEYEYVAINLLHKEQQADAYRAKNPMAQVPALEVTEGGETRTIAQSLPILEFLDEKFAEPPLLPRDPYARARCRELAEIVNSGIQPLQNLAVLRAVKAAGGDETAWPRTWIGNGLAAFERALVDVAGAFCVGESPTLADCCLVPQLAAARRFGVDLAPLERIRAIEARCLALPAFQRAAPDQQPDAVKS